MADTTVKLIIDTQGNVDGVDEAQGAFSSLGDTLDKVGEIAAAIGLEKLGEEAVDAAKDAFSAVADFQSYATSLGGLLANLGNGGDQASDDFTASTGTVSHAAQETADEMRNYTQKMADLQSQLADVMKGQNILDETSQVNEQLEEMAEEHAQKLIGYQNDIEAAQDQVIQDALQRAQSLQDRLDDMADSKANDDAERAEKEQQDLSDAKGDIQRQNIIDQYNQAQQLADDDYTRSLATAQKEGDIANAQAAAQDQQAADTKVATINDEITQENQSYDEQEAKVEAARDADLANLEADNAKKLAEVKQEIADEEIAHTESLEKISEEAASGGGSSSTLLDKLLPTDQFAAKSESLKDALSWLNNFAPKSPFEYSDIVQSADKLTAMGVNAQKLIPIIGDVSASFGQDLGTGTMAVMDGLNGRMESLQQQFGISSKEIANFNNGMKPTTQEQFLEALQKIAQVKFADGMQNQMETFNGRMSNLQDNLFRAGAAMLGFNSVTNTMVSGGVFDDMSKLVLTISTTIGNNIGNIQKFFTEFATGLQLVLQWFNQSFKAIIIPALQEFMTDILPPLTKMWQEHGQTIIQVAEFIGTTLMFAIDGLIAVLDIIIQVIVEVIDEFSDIIEWGEKVWNNTQTLIDQYGIFSGVLTELGNLSKSLFGAMWDDFKNYVNHVIDGINTLINVYDGVMPKLPGNTIALKIPDIPHLASGTSYFGGGAAVIGENGPEMVTMPRGASVTPASQTRNQVGKTVIVNQTNNIYNNTDTQAAMNKLNYAIAIR